MKRRLFITFIALLVAACSAGGTGPAAQGEAAATPAAATPAHRVTLPGGDTVEIADGAAVIVGSDGRVLARNARVVRGPDPDGRCPADGFRSVKAAGEGFVLRNMTCSGWFFIDEIMTFAPADGGYRLVRFSAEYLDRGTAEPSGPPRVLTEAEFGHRRFEDLDPDDLYGLMK